MSEFKDPGDVKSMKTGDQVFQAQCAACHTPGAAGAPKIGDEAAWAPRVKTGFDALLNSSLKGKGNMPPQGGGDHSDFEIARAVVFMANKAGAKFDEPKLPAAAASAPATAATQVTRRRGAQPPRSDASGTPSPGVIHPRRPWGAPGVSVACSAGLAAEPVSAGGQLPPARA